MVTGETVKEMNDHENTVSVCGLPNGDLVTGSAGRQVEAGALPSEFRLRLWRGGEVVKMVEDHTDSIKDLVAVPTVGFASCGNDG